MRTDGIKTSHDLADLLEDAARGLRLLPPFELAGDQRPNLADSAQEATRKNGDKKQIQERLSILVEQLPELNRSDAEAHLVSLTVDSIRQLAPLLDVRIPSKATKREYIQILLTQLFDAPAGQELIRTFHKRSEHPSVSKSPVASRGVRRSPSGKDRGNDGR